MIQLFPVEKNDYSYQIIMNLTPTCDFVYYSSDGQRIRCLDSPVLGKRCNHHLHECDTCGNNATTTAEVDTNRATWMEYRCDFCSHTSESNSPPTTVEIWTLDA